MTRSVSILAQVHVLNFRIDIMGQINNLFAKESTILLSNRRNMIGIECKKNKKQNEALKLYGVFINVFPSI